MSHLVDENYNPYKDSDGQLLFSPSFCVFMDMLGFSNLVLEKAKQGREVAFLNSSLKRYHRLVKEDLEEARLLGVNDGSSSNGKPLWMTKIYSNSFIMGCPLKYQGEFDLYLVTEAIKSFQLHLALYGFFVRGALSFGNLIMDDDLVFGTPLIEAVEGEKKADFPRIILTESGSNALKTFAGYYGQLQSSPHDNDYLMSEGHVFLDYLAHTIIYDSYLDTTSLARHKKVIVRTLKKFSECPKILRKYQWLACYHNAFCDAISPHPEFRDDFMIEGEYDQFTILGIDGEPLQRGVTMPEWLEDFSSGY